MSAHAATSRKITFPVVSSYQYSKAGAAELVDRVHAAVSQVKDFSIYHSPLYNGFQIQCYEQDFDAIVKKLCGVATAYEKDRENVRSRKVKRLNGARSLENESTSDPFTRSEDVESMSEGLPQTIFELQSMTKADHVFNEEILGEFQALTGVSLIIDHANHNLRFKATDRADEFIIRKKLRCIEDRHHALKPIITFLILHHQREGDDDVLRAFRLIDQPNHLLRRTLIDQDPALMNKLPVLRTWALSRSGLVDEHTYLGLTSGKLPELATCDSIWDYAASSATALELSLTRREIAQPATQEPSAVASDRHLDGQSRVSEWVPALDQQFDDLNQRARSVSVAPTVPTLAVSVIEVDSADEDEDDVIDDAALMSFDNLLSSTSITAGPSLINLKSDGPLTSDALEKPRLPGPTSSVRVTELPKARDRLIDVSADGPVIVTGNHTRAHHGSGAANSTSLECTSNDDLIEERLAIETDWPHKQTMRQRKGKSNGKAKSAVPQPYDHSHFTACLEGARYHRGIVSVHVDVGKALFEKPDLKRDLLKVDELQAKLDSASLYAGGPTAFTKMITSSIDDTRRIVLLPRTLQQAMFRQEPVDARSFFELRFRGCANVVEIDATGKQEIDTNTLGSCFMLYPEHVWDARFQVVGRRKVPIEPDMATVLDSIHTDSYELDLKWTNCNGRGPSVSRVLHKTGLRFNTSYAGWMLQMTEVKEHVLAEMNNGMHCSRAGSREEMINEGRLWYEIRLLSNAVPAFEQNVQLELGEMADYTSKIMTGEQLMNMRLFASDLIARMNSVGMDNQGPRGSDEELEQIAANKRVLAEGKLKEQNRRW